VEGRIMRVEVDICETKEIENSREEVETHSYRLYSDVENWDQCADVSCVYKTALREYGRCISKIYIDDKDGGSKHIGWVFQKRQKYEDCNETYLQETWIVPLSKYEVKRIREYAIQ
jgi:ferredoxin-thioredoxin reductase catalytic subunit